MAYYLADRSQALKTSTLGRRLAAIAEAHREAGVEPPNKSARVRLVWTGICREKGVAQSHKKPALTKLIRAMVEHLPDNLLGVRDRALILLGYAGAMRRSELVGLGTLPEHRLHHGGDPQPHRLPARGLGLRHPPPLRAADCLIAVPQVDTWRQR